MDERAFLERTADTYKTDGSVISKWSIDSYIRIYSRYVEKSGYGLTENDLAHGHRRVFDSRLLLELVSQSSFEIVDTGGTFLKPFADFQMNQMIEQKIIGEGQLRGLQEMAQIHPELSGSIYAVLERG